MEWAETARYVTVLQHPCACATHVPNSCQTIADRGFGGSRPAPCQSKRLRWVCVFEHAHRAVVACRSLSLPARYFSRFLCILGGSQAKNKPPCVQVVLHAKACVSKSCLRTSGAGVARSHMVLGTTVCVLFFFWCRNSRESDGLPGGSIWSTNNRVVLSPAGILLLLSAAT